MEKSIALIDMNSYFASVEQACNPGLRGKPVAVCGEGRTIVVTASYEARAYGVKTGMTKPEARSLCPAIIFVKGNLDKYIDTSFRIHKIMLDYTDKVEIFSIDECFLDLTHTAHLYGGDVAVAKEIKKRIKESFGLLCSIGIGPNKVIAKVGAKLNKPDGLTVIRKSEIAEKYLPLPVGKLQGVGVGRRIEEKFKMLGIKTAGDLGNAPPEILDRLFGVMGKMYAQIGQGTYDTPVKSYREQDAVKSVGHSHTLARDTKNLQVIRSYLQMLCEKVAARMRKYKIKGRTVALIIRYSDFDFFAKRHTIRQHISSGVEIFRAAWEIFEKECLPLDLPVRLVGVSVANVEADAGEQYVFEEMRKKEKVQSVMDEINNKYGASTIKPVSLIISEKFGILERCGLISTRVWVD
jgi:DNA polymerase IV